MHHPRSHLIGLFIVGALLAALAGRGGEHAVAVATQPGVIEAVRIDADINTPGVQTCLGNISQGSSITVDIILDAVDPADGTLDFGGGGNAGITFDDSRLDFVSASGVGPLSGVFPLGGSIEPVDATFSRLGGFTFFVFPGDKPEFSGVQQWYRVNLTASAAGVATVEPTNVSGYDDSRDIVINMGSSAINAFDPSDENSDGFIINSLEGAQLAIGEPCAGGGGAAADTVADLVFGQAGSFASGSCNLGGLSPDSSCSPSDVAVGADGNVYVTDFDNNRVLGYDDPPNTDSVADRVFGQGGSFTSSSCNLGGVSASSLCGPSGVAVDAEGNLYVADQRNRRVLVYQSPLTTDTVADLVLGQGGSFTSRTCNLGGVSASSLCNPWDVAVDGADNLYVADQGNSRVLEYDSPLATDTVADRVIGQGGSFTSAACNLSGLAAESLCFPRGLTSDGDGNVYVADYDNSRVLEYDSPLTSDAVADQVFGQGGSFTSDVCDLGGVTDSSLCFPSGVGVDGNGNLYVADESNHRVLEYDAPLATDTVADQVFGQGDSFTSSSCNVGGLSASSLCGPSGLALDSTGNLYIADHNNHRVLEFDIPADLDGDGVPDDTDNCPAVPNGPNEAGISGVGNQTNSDTALGTAGATINGVLLPGDAEGDACDDDDDNDSFSGSTMLTQDPGAAATSCPDGDLPLWADCVESYLGTETGDNCPGSPGPGGDAWPPDIDQNGIVSGGDPFAIFPFWLTASARHDLNADGIVSGGDIFSIFPLWLFACT
ncbi:hypothetical protein LCGC14_1858370 [marine sediment metagenome]|uniref:Dockerin domain-containing protein n=1 Tax=marine sediment metagenome TaxID=412755 RepID=A0A0F9G817_9ZZZZ